MDLQYQLGNGNWTDCGDRAEEFLSRAMSHNKFDRETIVARLTAGMEVRHAGDYWYALIRVKPAPRPVPASNPRPVLRCRKCGQTGHRGSYPFSTLPGSGRCDDCV